MDPCQLRTGHSRTKAKHETRGAGGKLIIRTNGPGDEGPAASVHDPVALARTYRSPQSRYDRMTISLAFRWTVFPLKTPEVHSSTGCWIVGRVKEWQHVYIESNDQAGWKFILMPWSTRINVKRQEVEN